MPTLSSPPPPVTTPETTPRRSEKAFSVCCWLFGRGAPGSVWPRLWPPPPHQSIAVPTFANDAHAASIFAKGTVINILAAGTSGRQETGGLDLKGDIVTVGRRPARSLRR